MSWTVVVINVTIQGMNNCYLIFHVHHDRASAKPGVTDEPLFLENMREP